MYPDGFMELPNEDFFGPVNIKHEVLSDSGSETSDTPTYTDLSSSHFHLPTLDMLKQEKQVFGEHFDSLLSWTSKHPEHWTQSEVLDWVYYVAEVKHLDGSKFYGERYQSINGLEMCHMTRGNFIGLDSNYGALLYDLFRSLVQKSKFSEPLPPESLNPDAYHFLETTFPCLPVPFSSCQDASSQQGDDLSVFVSDSGIAAADIDGCVYDFDIASKFDFPAGFRHDDQGYVSGGSEMDTSTNAARCGSTSSEAYDVFSISDDEDLHAARYNHYNHTKKRQSPSSSDEDMEERQAPQRRRINSTSKGNHLWEFIRDLLKDPHFNPSLLKWEDKEIGVFKFVQSEAVANMWGRKKNNPGMTYEKLSRAMRFCRTAGYFGDVPKNGRFPKKLCFRFGPKAHDWK